MNRKQMNKFLMSTVSGPVLSFFLSWFQPMTTIQHKNIMVRAAPWLGIAPKDTK